MVQVKRRARKGLQLARALSWDLTLAGWLYATEGGQRKAPRGCWVSTAAIAACVHLPGTLPAIRDGPPAASSEWGGPPSSPALLPFPPSPHCQIHQREPRSPQHQVVWGESASSQPPRTLTPPRPTQLPLPVPQPTVFSSLLWPGLGQPFCLPAEFFMEA